MTLSRTFASLAQGDSAPVKMFDRTPNLTGSQIINYKASPDGKWLVLIGIAPGAPEARHTIARRAALAPRPLRRRRPPPAARAHGR